MSRLNLSNQNHFPLYHLAWLRRVLIHHFFSRCHSNSCRKPFASLVSIQHASLVPSRSFHRTCADGALGALEGTPPNPSSTLYTKLSAVLQMQTWLTALSTEWLLLLVDWACTFQCATLLCGLPYLQWEWTGGTQIYPYFVFSLALTITPRLFSRITFSLSLSSL